MAINKVRMQLVFYINVSQLNHARGLNGGLYTKENVSTHHLQPFFYYHFSLLKYKIIVTKISGK